MKSTRAAGLEPAQYDFGDHCNTIILYSFYIKSLYLINAIPIKHKLACNIHLS